MDDYKAIKEGKIEVVDIGDNLDQYLDRKTVERLNEPVKKLEDQTFEDTSKHYKVVYLGKKVDGPLTEDVIKEFAKHVNNLGRKYIIRGALLKCSQMSLANNITVIISYIALAPKDAEEFLKGISK